MQGKNLERCQRVCSEAAAEQDAQRFLQLTREILRMLTEKQRRLEPLPAKRPVAGLKSKIIAAC